MAAHSSILAWRIPWTEEPGGLQIHGVAQSRTRFSTPAFCSRELRLQAWSLPDGEPRSCPMGHPGSLPGGWASRSPGGTHSTLRGERGAWSPHQQKGPQGTPVRHVEPDGLWEDCRTGDPPHAGQVRVGDGAAEGSRGA